MRTSFVVVSLLVSPFAWAGPRHPTELCGETEPCEAGDRKADENRVLPEFHEPEPAPTVEQTRRLSLGLGVQDSLGLHGLFDGIRVGGRLHNNAWYGELNTFVGVGLAQRVQPVDAAVVILGAPSAEREFSAGNVDLLGGWSAALGVNRVGWAAGPFVAAGVGGQVSVTQTVVSAEQGMATTTEPAGVRLGPVASAGVEVLHSARFGGRLYFVDRLLVSTASEPERRVAHQAMAAFDLTFAL